MTNVVLDPLTVTRDPLFAPGIPSFYSFLCLYILQRGFPSSSLFLKEIAVQKNGDGKYIGWNINFNLITTEGKVFLHFISLLDLIKTQL